MVCFSSLKQGFFNDTNSVVRVGLIKGNGEPIQTGGNKVSDQLSFGLPLTRLVTGSNYNLGLVYEVLLSMKPSTASDGHFCSISIAPNDVPAILKGWQAYIDSKAPVLVDAMVITFDQGKGSMHTFSLGDESETSVKGALSKLEILANVSPVNRAELHKELSPQLNPIGHTLEVQIPLKGLIKVLPEFIE